MSTRLHVATVLDTLSPFGGAERLARELAKRLDPARFERSFWATRPSPRADAAELLEAGVSVHELDRRSAAHLRAWTPFVRFLREQPVDVLHLHKFGSNVWGSALGRLARVPVVIAQEHTWSFHGQPLRRHLDRHVVSRWADAFVAVSREDRRRMIEIEGVDPAIIRLIPNGIPPLPAPSGGDLRSELGMSADAPLVGSVGNLRRQKALHLLVEAAGMLRGEFPGMRVAIAGRGEEEAALRELLSAAGLDGVVSLLGPRRDVPDVLAALDVAVNTSDFEGTPLSVLEYMAAGKAIVATRVGGVPDLIRDGAEGVLVPPGDAKAVAAAVGALLRNPERRGELGRRALARQRREFDIDVTVRRFEDLYESLWAGRGRR